MNYKNEEGQTVGGNYGLNDQLIALKFIHQNKAHLGCSRITINGESVRIQHQFNFKQNHENFKFLYLKSTRFEGKFNP